MPELPEIYLAADKINAFAKHHLFYALETSLVTKNPKVQDKSRKSTEEERSAPQAASQQPIPILQSPYPFYGSMPVEIVEQVSK